MLQVVKCILTSKRKQRKQQNASFYVKYKIYVDFAKGFYMIVVFVFEGKVFAIFEPTRDFDIMRFWGLTLFSFEIFFSFTLRMAKNLGFFVARMRSRVKKKKILPKNYVIMCPSFQFSNSKLFHFLKTQNL